MHPILLVIVPRFRSRNQNRLRPVNRIKHVVDAQAALVAGTLATEDLIRTADAEALLANVRDVNKGSTVNGIYLKLEVTATTSAALSNVYMAVGKNPGANLTLPNPNVVGISDNKKYIIHQEMVMMQRQDLSNPRTVFNGVIVIPRGYRRFGPQDELQLLILAPGITIDYCLQCHFKEFR